MRLFTKQSNRNFKPSKLNCTLSHVNFAGCRCYFHMYNPYRPLVEHFDILLLNEACSVVTCTPHFTLGAATAAVPLSPSNVCICPALCVARTELRRLLCWAKIATRKLRSPNSNATSWVPSPKKEWKRLHAKDKVDGWHHRGICPPLFTCPRTYVAFLTHRSSAEK